MKFFLFHCWGGDGRSCWSGWLADTLRAEGYEVFSPDFPDTNEPELTQWLAKVRETTSRFDSQDEWVLIGHSLGCPTILRLLEGFDGREHVKGVVLVAGFAKDLGIPAIRGFIERPFDWKKIRACADKFVIINSDDDPYIELKEGERLAKLLAAKLIVEHGAGHINEGSGFTSYPRLLGTISEL